MRRRLTGSIALLAGLLVVSCLPGGRVPGLSTPVRSPPGRSLGLATEAAPPSGPLAVAFASPQGEQVEAPLPTLVFTRSMHALGSAPHEPAVVATIEPPVEGHWRWIDSRTVQFSPRRGFAPATPYTITVAPLRSLDGQTLAEPTRLAFATPRLALDSIDLNDGPRENLRVRFNQYVLPQALLAALQVRDSGGRRVELEAIDTTRATWLDLRPRRPWPAGRLDVTIAGDLRGAEGTLGLAQAQTRRLREPEPVTVSSLQCGYTDDVDCQQSETVRLELSAPLPLATVRPLVRVSPPLPFELRPTNLDQGQASSFELRAAFKLGVTYTIEVRPTPERPGGQPALAEGATRRMRPMPPGPEVAILAHGTYLLPSWTDPLEVQFERVKQASVTVTPLDLAAVRAASGRQASEFTLPAGGATRELPSPGDWSVLAIGDLMPPRPGPVMISARWEGRLGEKGSRQQVIQRTDLALSVRATPETVLVWVSRLSTGEPVPGARVTLQDAAGHEVEATASAEGIVELPVGELGQGTEPTRVNYWRRSVQLTVVARSGDDWIHDQVSMPEAPALEGFLFADRGIYRPGETVHLKGIVRRPSIRGLEPPVGRPVKLQLAVPGSPDVTVTRTLSAWGTFSHDLVLPADAPPRRVDMTVTDGRTTVARRHVEIRHVRPASFRVQASFDRPHYVVGDEMICQGTAAYLYGGSVAGARGTLEIAQYESFFEAPSLPGYRIGRTTRSSSPRVLERASRQLDDRRPWQLRRRQVVEGPTMVQCEATVSDEGQQTARDEAAAWLHPAARYAALSGVPSTPTVGQVLRPQVLVVTPQGERQEAPVRLSLRERLEKSDGYGPETAVCEVHPGAEPASCALPVPPVTRGYYLLSATVSDAQGRRATTEMEIHPEAPRPPPPPAVVAVQPARPALPPAPPLLRLESDHARSGDTARLLLAPERPFRRALVTVEREGLFLHQLLDTGRTTSEFAVTGAMGPGVQVSLTTVYPVATPTPYGSAPFALERASQRLNVELPSRELRVQITPSRTEGVPGDEVEVDVAVAASDGRPAAAEVTVYAVDEGMLQLSDYVMPAPGLSIRPEFEVRMDGDETRSRLGWLSHATRSGRLSGSHQARAPQVRMGASGVSQREGSIRSNFEPTPLFAAALETGADGHVQARFKLPDNLTAYRIMAVAVARDDRYGQAEAQVQVRLPAQIRPVFPPLVRAGDRFEAAAVAANNTDHPLELVATLQADGALQGSLEPRRLTLAAGESRRVSFQVLGARVGPGRLTTRLASVGGEVLDGATLAVTVESPVTLEASALSGSTDGAVEETLANLSALRPDAGELQVTVSTSPVAGLAVGLEQLVTYPYGCTEQTVSRLVPLLALRDLARSLGVALPADVDAASRQSVERLLGHRDSHGRFGLWPGSHPTRWLTAYGYWGLAEAQRRGLPVDDEIMATGRRELSDIVSRWAEGPTQAAEACFALDVVAPLPGAATAHARTVARQMLADPGALPPFARALLLHALVELGVDEAERAPLVRSLEASLQVDGPTARAVETTGRLDDLLDSRARTSALVLRALLAAAPSHPLLEPLARGLVADRGPTGWRTTQETTWALLALDAFQRAAPPRPGRLPVSASVGARSLLDLTLDGLAEHTARLPMADLVAAGAAPLHLEAHGRSAYYQVRLRHAPAAAPTSPLMAGFEVSKRCHPVERQTPPEDDTAPPASSLSFAVGQWVRCELTVSTPTARRFVAIDDPVPAGFEVLDPSLTGTPGWLQAWMGGQQDRRELRPGRVVLFRDQLPAGLHRWSYVARAATAGDFSAPPTRADEMYTPETFGRTAAMLVHIAAAP